MSSAISHESSKKRQGEPKPAWGWRVAGLLLGLALTLAGAGAVFVNGVQGVQVSALPQAASCAAELEVVMGQMAEASKRWRDQHAMVNRLEGYLNSREGTVEGRRITARKVATAQAEEADKLETFRRACYRVGQLRGELDQTAGPGWRLAMGGIPGNHGNKGKKASYRSDMSVTHCPEGHELTRENSLFEKSPRRGVFPRLCRICSNMQQQKRRMETRPNRAMDEKRVALTASSRMGVTVQAEVLEAAKAILEDPSKDALSVAAVSRIVGVCHTTLVRRLPEVMAARSARKYQNWPRPLVSA